MQDVEARDTTGDSSAGRDKYSALSQQRRRARGNPVTQKAVILPLHMRLKPHGSQIGLSKASTEELPWSCSADCGRAAYALVAKSSC